MALHNHCFWCLFYVIWALFWLVLNFNLVNITDFTSSKFKYLIFTRLKFLSLSLHSILQVSLSCWTSRNAFFLMVSPGLASVFAYSYILLWSDSFSCITCIFCHTWCIASVDVLYYNIYRFLLIDSHSYFAFAACFDLVFVYLSLLSWILLCD